MLTHLSKLFANFYKINDILCKLHNIFDFAQVCKRTWCVSDLFYS